MRAVLFLIVDLVNKTPGEKYENIQNKNISDPNGKAEGRPMCTNGHPCRSSWICVWKGKPGTFSGYLSAGADAVLVAGDMVVSSDPSSAAAVAGFFCRLANSLPVFYVMGNHENKMLMNPETSEKYKNYERVLTNAGVCFLHNEHIFMRIRGTDFVFYGLELPMEYYREPASPYPDQEVMEKLIGRSSEYGVSVLLAHNPKYGDAYFQWGADLTGIRALPWRSTET